MIEDNLIYRLFTTSPSLLVNFLWCALWAFMAGGLTILILTFKIIKISTPFIIASVLDKTDFKNTVVKLGEERWKKYIEKKEKERSEQNEQNK